MFMFNLDNAQILVLWYCGLVAERKTKNQNVSGKKDEELVMGKRELTKTDV